MKSTLYNRQSKESLPPVDVENLEFSACLRLIWELQALKTKDLQSLENRRIIKDLETRIKYLGRTESYKCMAALPAVKSLVN